MNGIEGHDGYYSRITGDRLIELLNRQYTVPTLNSIPDSTTIKWMDGKYEVFFRIGEFVRVLIGDSYVYFRLKDIKDNHAEWEQLDSFKLEDYYTKKDIDDKGYLTEQDISHLATKEYVQEELENASVDLSNYYTKTQVDSKLEDLILSGGGGGVEVLSPEEYDNKKQNNSIISNMIYLLVVNNAPYELYVGTILIGKKSELESIGFPYTFPIIF